ncbi:MAG: T9SS type A sorting domain-containing protein [Bacteroidetes bacterium]|nr:T9SS type A sorting domain-containing protein [Bacteroidota bacterium]
MQQISYLKSIPLVFMIFMCFGNQCVYGTHAAGSDLTYTCLGGNQYRLEATFYRDCNGIPEPAFITFYYRSASCGFNYNVTATPDSGSGVEISLPCSTAVSTCNGGTESGVRKFVYHATINLPGNCADWVFSYSVCCRNCTITTIQDPCGSGSNLYVEAKLNNLNAICNSSPVFSNNPIAFVCLGQNFNFNQGVYDADGDSLSYSFITPKTGPTTQVQFISPATVSNPLASSTPFLINPVTGDINFTPSQIQVGILAVLVKEFRNGILIGSVIRDIQVYTTSCNNVIPSASGINGTSGYDITVCPGQTICFTVYTSDADSNQSVSTIINNTIQGSTISSTGGSRPEITFCWTPDFDDVNLLPNSFTVTVRDNSCPSNGIQTFSYNIFVPAPYFTTNTQAVSCFSGNDGIAVATPVYGNLYSYSWNTTPVQNTSTAIGLSAGTYTLTVSDTSGCSLSVPVMIEQPLPLQVSGNVSPASCGSCNGTISLAVTGGNQGYSFVWNDGNTTPSRTNLCAGIYTVSVTDVNGCTVIASYLVNQQSSFTVTAIATPVSCAGGNDGIADITVTGGSGSFGFLWSDGQTTEDAISLAPGIYTVTITDAGSCSSMIQVQITQPAPVFITATIANVTCHGTNDGLIDVTVSGGTSPYDYFWSDGSFSEDISTLESGIYVLTVSDLFGCIAQEQFIISQPDPIAITFTTTDATCFGSTDGAIQVSANGGNAPFSYFWQNGSTDTTLQNLASGTYMLTVTDNHACSIITAFAVSQPDEILIQFQQTFDPCNAGTGSVATVISGGNDPFIYSWSDGSAGSSISGVNPGIYTLTITDAFGCMVSDTVSVGGITDPMTLAFNSVSSSCHDTDDGSADLTISGGQEPYSYLWSNGNTAEDLLLVLGGNYDVTVTDANGCTVAGNVLIEAPEPMAVSFNVIPVGCGVTKGTITAHASGGTPAYAYVWATGETTSFIDNLDPGFFNVTVTDINGCSVTDSVEVIAYPELIATVETGDASFPGAADGSIDLSVNGGAIPYLYEWSDGSVTEDLSGVVAGIYTVTITDFSGCQLMLTAEVMNSSLTSLNNNGNDQPELLISQIGGSTFLQVTASGNDNYNLELYDNSGRLISGFLSGQMQKGEVRKIEIPEKNIASGLYIIVLRGDNNVKSMKMMLRN